MPVFSGGRDARPPLADLPPAIVCQAFGLKTLGGGLVGKDEGASPW